MEDKIYELLTIMHNDIKRLEKKVDSIDNRVILIENENHIQHTALYDGYRQAIELGEENNRLLKHINGKQTTIDVKIDIIKDKTENIEIRVEKIEKEVQKISNIVKKQEVEIRVIKGGK